MEQDSGWTRLWRVEHPLHAVHCVTVTRFGLGRVGRLNESGNMRSAARSDGRSLENLTGTTCTPLPDFDSSRCPLRSVPPQWDLLTTADYGVNLRVL
jgi:hypothetical protein